MLVLFDIVEPSNGRFGLRDLLLVKASAHCSTDGLQISEVMQELAAHEKRSTTCRPTYSAIKRAEWRSGSARRSRKSAASSACLSASPDDLSVDELFDAAEEAEDLGDWRKAERLYRRCVDRDRKDPASAYNLGNVLCRLGREREARLWLQHAVGLDPALAEGWYNLGLVTNASGDRGEACRHFERALAADPKFADAMFNLRSFASKAASTPPPRLCGSAISNTTRGANGRARRDVGWRCAASSYPRGSNRAIGGSRPAPFPEVYNAAISAITAGELVDHSGRSHEPIRAAEDQPGRKRLAVEAGELGAVDRHEIPEPGCLHRRNARLLELAGYAIAQCSRQVETRSSTTRAARRNSVCISASSGSAQSKPVNAS